MTEAEFLIIREPERDPRAETWCAEFMSRTSGRFVFGCNEWAKSISEIVPIDGFIDDFTAKTEFCGKPILRSSGSPRYAKVVSAIVGERPLTAMKALIDQDISCLDYFSFAKHSGLKVKSIQFLDGFDQEVKKHETFYHQLYSELADIRSKKVLQQLIHFRMSHDLKYLSGFSDIQYRQYFESFLGLRTSGETFLDVGCFDGFTSEEFSRRCPRYIGMHVFEPEPTNMSRVKERLSSFRDITFHPYGASNRVETLRFQAGGSSSRLSDRGDIEVTVKPIDDVVSGRYTFLKMDIEGGELAALEGARESITTHRPRLAIGAYHRADDLRKIYQLITSYVSDYSVYLRHYTEGITESVLFFVPNELNSVK